MFRQVLFGFVIFSYSSNDDYTKNEINFNQFER